MSNELLAAIVSKAGYLCVVIALDVISGVFVALRAGEFKWEKLPAFMQKYLFYIGAWLLAESTIAIPEDIYNLAGLPVSYEIFTSIGPVAYGITLAGGLSSFLTNLAVSIPGLADRIGKFGFNK